MTRRGEPVVAHRCHGVDSVSGGDGVASGIWVRGCVGTSDLPDLDAKPDFSDPTQAPGDNWVWKGKDAPGGVKGNWVNLNRPGFDAVFFLGESGVALLIEPAGICGRSRVIVFEPRHQLRDSKGR